MLVPDTPHRETVPLLMLLDDQPGLGTGTVVGDDHLKWPYRLHCVPPEYEIEPGGGVKGADDHGNLHMRSGSPARSRIGLVEQWVPPIELPESGVAFRSNQIFYRAVRAPGRRAGYFTEVDPPGHVVEVDP